MKNRNKCKTCQHYEPFFDSCNLYYEEVYVGEGEFDLRPVRTVAVSESECEFSRKEK